MVNSQGWEVKDLTPFRLMDLPRELRDGVYRELLLPNKIRGEPRADGGKRYYTIQPAILRVCKQTYRESSRVLYQETKWVLVTTFEDENGLINMLKRRTLYPFVAVQSPLCFPETPVLRIDMTGRKDNNKCQAFMLIPQQDFQFLGKVFLPHACTNIALRFDEDAIQIPSTRENLLDCCRDFRGSHSVTIQGLGSPTECAKLEGIMTTPIRRDEEYLERAKTYQERAEKQLAQGLFMDADRTNEAGALYARSALYVRFTERQRTGGWTPGSDSHGKNPFTEIEVEFLIASAYCRTKAGHPEKSRILLDSILAHDKGRRSPTKQQEIKIHYYKALAFVAERDDIHAAEELRVVLSLQPGHEGADQQVDSMEARLQKMPQSKKCEVEAFLRDVVKPHRHRELGSAALSKVEMPVDDLSKIAI